MRTFILCLLLGYALSLALASEPDQAPVVKIATPYGGQSSKRIVDVQGSISDETLQQAYIVINGAANAFDISGGRFSHTVVLSPGENIIQIIAENKFGVGRDTLVIYSAVPARDVKVVMTWDTPTDIDLHVIDPSGEETYYSQKESKIGGQLDRDDTDGFGPEVFTLSNAIEGQYIVKTKYYGGHSGQTLVKITVILFGGTAKESQQDYFRLLTQSGEFAEVCSFSVKQ